MIGALVLILLFLYLFTIRSISRQNLSYTSLFLYTFFFIVAIGTLKDMAVARARAQTVAATQVDPGHFLKVGQKSSWL